MLYKALRSEYSKVGFYLTLYLLLSTIISSSMLFIYTLVGSIFLYATNGSLTQEEVARLVAPSNNTFMMLTINALAIYVVSMPVIIYLMKNKFPTPDMKAALSDAKNSAEMFSPEGVLRREAAEEIAYPDQDRMRESSVSDPDRIRLFEIPEAPADVPPPEKDYFGIRDIPALLFMCIFAMATGDIISYVLISIINKVTGISPANTQVDFLVSGGTVLTIIFVVIIAPVAEELFFRKFLIDRMIHSGKWSALLISALTFSLYHQNIYQFFYALLFGLVLGYLYIKTGKVIYTIIFHMLMNLMGGLVLPYFTRSAVNYESYLDVIKAGDYTLIITDVIWILAALIGLVIFIYYLKKGKLSFREAQWIPDKITVAKAVFSAPGMIVLILACIISSALTMLGELQ